MSWARRLAGLLVVGAVVLPAASAGAVPAFARRYEVSCGTCHQYHYPRLNAFGTRFMLNGYQLPDGAEDPARARRMLEPGTIADRLTVFRELPLSVRAQAVADFDRSSGEHAPVYDSRVSASLAGGGSVARDVSFFFSWNAAPTPLLHQARVGLHNLGARALGAGAVNVKAGLLLLLDGQRPAHRSLAPGTTLGVAVGQNPFVLDDSTLGLALYGRPGWGRFGYEVALVSGPPGVGADPDQWKDVFGRVSWTFFLDTPHELEVGVLGYLGRASLVSQVGGITIDHRDDFWLAGGDLELDLGPVTAMARGFFSRHDDATPAGGAVDLTTIRAELIWGVNRHMVAGLALDANLSPDDHDLERSQLAAHASHVVASNVLGTVVVRGDVQHAEQFSASALLEVAF